MDCRTAVKLLHDLTTFRLGQERLSNADLLATIEEIETRFAGRQSFELELVLGGALNTYVFNCVRGDARGPFLQRIVRHWERAADLARGAAWDILPRFRLQPELYAHAILGSFLVCEAPVRDLDKALQHLEQVRCSTSWYVPELGTYADALYKRGDYLGCARIAAELRARADGDPEWRGVFAPQAFAPLLAKAYRAEAKRRQKQGDLQGAAKMFEALVDTGAATLNDLRLTERLRKSMQLNQ
jgi:tetratricopeptide (TPR) repeat protein